VDARIPRPGDRARVPGAACCAVRSAYRLVFGLSTALYIVLAVVDRETAGQVENFRVMEEIRFAIVPVLLAITALGRMSEATFARLRRRAVDLLRRVHRWSVDHGSRHARAARLLWGDTVNTASRMESHGGPGRIRASAPSAALTARNAATPAYSGEPNRVNAARPSLRRRVRVSVQASWTRARFPASNP
jgi:Adenylate and Guanylate cyclase catalytic domain